MNENKNTKEDKSKEKDKSKIEDVPKIDTKCPQNVDDVEGLIYIEE